MQTGDVLTDGFDRVQGIVHDTLDGLSAEDLAFRPDPAANSIAWLVWHLSRIEDDHVAGLLGVEQRYTADGWADRFGFPFDDRAHGYGQSSEDVAAVRVDGPGLLAAYPDAPPSLTVSYCGPVPAAELARVVDSSWDPPVTAGV